MLSKGEKGEKIAEKYLTSNGYRIVCKNFRSKMGEVDIIAERDNDLYIIEVKYRSNKNFGYGFESITEKKKNAIINTAKYYIMKTDIKKRVRFDVISIDDGNITHIQDAF